MTRAQAGKAFPWAVGVLLSIALALGSWSLTQAYSHEGAVQKHEAQLAAQDKRQDCLERDVREIRRGVETLLRRIPGRD